ncbi:MAG TPA: hypothetical protein VHT97_03490 [Acidimicrobiales bacterium]|jgi:hypothetical protein|nr:hypothetical protein [Acidimicrobiales bacterium]
MGFLDRAKKLADQAREKAEEALAEAKSRAESMKGSSSSSGSSGATSTVDRDPRWGTPYVPGMLGRPGWRERGLTDPAAVLPIADRDAAGVPHTTRSAVVEEPYGMGRRWSAGERTVGLFYQLYPEQIGWEPPGGKGPYSLPGASIATTGDGRSLVFFDSGDRRVVLESNGLDGAAEASLARSVADHLDAQ